MTVLPELDDSVFICPGCGIDAWDFQEDGVRVHEDFYVHDDLWQRVAGGESDRIVCIGCFERRLGRELSRADFKGPPHDLFGTPPSERFKERFSREIVDLYG